MSSGESIDIYTIREQLDACSKKRIVIGAEGRHDELWIPTEIEFLNLLNAADWERLFTPDSLDAMLAEHVWEHLAEEEGIVAARICYKYLKPGGYLRVAVPDGLHPDPKYVEWVEVGGIGPGADDHKILYTYETLKRVFESIGFKVVLHEYFDEAGHFHYHEWDPQDGMIHRSRENDKRNQGGTLNYTSIILDAIKDTEPATVNDIGAEWDRIAPLFSVGTALPNFGPLAPTETMLRLVGSIKGITALELGCGEGYSLNYLAENGAAELWGLDLSNAQLSMAASLLHKHRSIVHLFNSPMEVNPDLPLAYFDLVFSIYALGFSTDLDETCRLIAAYLKPGGCFIFSDEHPVYSCLTLKDSELIFQEPYTVEGPYRKEIGNEVSLTMHKRTLSTFINALIDAGLQVERLIEGQINYEAAEPKHYNATRWYSVQRARIMPTTFILKARKPGYLG